MHLMYSAIDCIAVLHLDLQVVDERLWDEEDEKGGDEEGRGQRKEEYDDKGTLQVDDKKDLEYEVRGRVRVRSDLEV
jgi:hypothetical protein